MELSVSEGPEEAVAGEREEAASSSFVLDEASHLYFHASSGFYHDPHAGWYYSSTDGVYYRFEDGNYVPLDRPPDLDASAESGGGRYAEIDRDGASRHTRGETLPDAVKDNEAYDGDDGLENHRPPSEWLEETLINIYLSGHSELELVENDKPPDGWQCGEISNSGFEPHAGISTSNNFSTFHAGFKSGEMEENRRISDDTPPFNSDNCVNEEHWKAQFGQVVKPEDEDAPNFPVIDLWDWSTVSELEKRQEVRLVGRLVRHSEKLHPSLPAVGLLKTAKISEVRLDLVRVATGKIYRLRNPSSGYLASLPAYDASDPTKRWGFPSLDLSSTSKVNALGTSNDVQYQGLPTSHPGILPGKNKNLNLGYRDRAAERRALHGSYGVGLGEKRQRCSEELEETKVLSEMEAINMSCGPGSYSRRIMESMGWKEGEALGRWKDGPLEPLLAVRNRGNAGLGWNRLHEI